MVVSVDVHKGTHTALAVDEVGRELGGGRCGRPRPVIGSCCGGCCASSLLSSCDSRWRIAGTSRLGWSGICSPPSSGWCGCPPKLVAGARAPARTRGKSDPIDALAIARAAPQEPNLPVASHDAVSREIKLLVDHR